MNENTVQQLVHVGKRLKKLALANKDLITVGIDVFHQVNVHVTEEAMAEIVKDHPGLDFVNRYPGEECPKDSYRWEARITIDNMKFFALGNEDENEYKSL